MYIKVENAEWHQAWEGPVVSPWLVFSFHLVSCSEALAGEGCSNTVTQDAETTRVAINRQRHTAIKITTGESQEWEKSRLSKQRLPVLASPYLALAACSPCRFARRPEHLPPWPPWRAPTWTKASSRCTWPYLRARSPSYVHLDRRYWRRTALQDPNLEFWTQVCRRWEAGWNWGYMLDGSSVGGSLRPSH